MLNNVSDRQYIDAKNVAYNFYDFFSKLDSNLKTEFLEYISSGTDMDDFLKEVTVTTLLYPNDYFLLNTTGSNALLQNFDALIEQAKIDKTILNSKRREFQFMNYSKLLSNGYFKEINFSKFPKTSDNVYNEYVLKFEEIRKNDNKSK